MKCQRHFWLPDESPPPLVIAVASGHTQPSSVASTEAVDVWGRIGVEAEAAAAVDTGVLNPSSSQDGLDTEVNVGSDALDEHEAEAVAGGEFADDSGSNSAVSFSTDATGLVLLSGVKTTSGFI